MPRSVVLDDDAEVRRAVVVLVSCDERGLEPGDADLHVEVVLLQVLGQLLDRPLFYKTDFRMRGDVVRHREQLAVHQRLRARHDLIARRIRAGQPRDDAGHVERLLERGHFLEHAGRGLALRGRLLRAAR